MSERWGKVIDAGNAAVLTAACGLAFWQGDTRAAAAWVVALLWWAIALGYRRRLIRQREDWVSFLRELANALRRVGSAGK